MPQQVKVFVTKPDGNSTHITEKTTSVSCPLTTHTHKLKYTLWHMPPNVPHTNKKI